VTEERDPTTEPDVQESAQQQAQQPGTQPETEPDTGSVSGAEAEDAIDDAPVAAENVPTDAVVEDGGDDLQVRVDELTTDLQRLQAEYLNYKRRVDRDRELIRENATYAVLSPIIEVLDTIDRAREHGEVEGGFKAVADQLERIVSGQGLKKFGAPGEVFDPTLHEALSHLGTDAEVTETTVKVVAKAGYRIGERVVRAAQVLVVDPE